MTPRIKVVSQIVKQYDNGSLFIQCGKGVTVLVLELA